LIAMPKIVYLWWSVAGLLLLAEMLVPGASLLWLGLAALATGLVLMVWPLLSALLQALVFGGFAVVAVAVYLRYFRLREPKTDRPLLNRRAAQLIGQEFALTTAIELGRGKIRIGDALWTVTGPELALGTKGKVMATDGVTLTVIASE